jgi:transcriptional regulator with XRE-family HTH domain
MTEKLYVLQKILPEEKDFEKKQLKVLEIAYSNGWNISGTARVLGISRNSTAKLLRELRETPIYEKFCKELEIRLGDFYDKSFMTTLFQRYEAEYERLESMIRSAERAGNDSKVLQLMKLKHNLMSVQLKASLACQQMKLEDDMTRSLQEKYRDLYEEAFDEFGTLAKCTTVSGNN